MEKIEKGSRINKVNENCFNCALFKWDEWRQGNFPCEYYSERMYLNGYKGHCDYYIFDYEKASQKISDPPRENFVKFFPSYKRACINCKFCNFENIKYNINRCRYYHGKPKDKNLISYYCENFMWRNIPISDNFLKRMESVREKFIRRDPETDMRELELKTRTRELENGMRILETLERDYRAYQDKILELSRMYHPKYPQNNAFSAIIVIILIILSIMVTALFCTVMRF